MFDFSPWRPILAQRFQSHFGPRVFDPVSVGLGVLLALWRGWSWSTLVRELQSPERGQGYCRRLGFAPHDLPAESTWRTALNKTQVEWWLQCADSLVEGLMALDLLRRRLPLPGPGPSRWFLLAHRPDLTRWLPAPRPRPASRFTIVEASSGAAELCRKP